MRNYSLVVISLLLIGILLQLSSCKSKQATTNMDAQSILYVDLEPIIETHFKGIFKRYGFKKIEYGQYKNAHCLFRIAVIDQVTMRMEFAHPEKPDTYFNLYGFLCTTMREKYFDLDFNVFSPEVIEGKSPSERVDAHIKKLAKFSDPHLDAPFSGDFSWVQAYKEVLHFLQNHREIIRTDDRYTELRPQLKNFKQDSLKRLTQAALSKYFELKEE